MSNIKLGESTLNNVESLKAIDANDSTKYHIFYNEQKAILIVTAPAGSTIDILQNSIVLQTYTLGASETTHEFRVSVSATQYIVRATLDTKTASKNVLVEQASVYNISLAFVTYIYDGTTLFYPITYYGTTGGWSRYASESVTKNSDNLYISFLTNGSTAAIETNWGTQPIDLTPFSKLYFDVTLTANRSGAIFACVLCEPKYPGSGGTVNVAMVSAPAGTSSGTLARGVYSASIASLTGSYRIGFEAYDAGWGGSKVGTCYGIWLE